MPLVRVQGPTGTHDVEMGGHARLKDLRRRIEDLLGIPPAEQQIKAGFPPQAISAGEEEELSNVLGTGSTRITVARTGPVAVAAGSGRRKPQAVRRVVPGSAGNAGATGLASGSQPSSLGAGSSAGGEAGCSSSAPAAAPAVKRKRGSKAATPAADDEEGDPLKHTLKAAKDDAAKAPGRGKGSRPRTVEQLLQDYNYGSGSALQLAARGGGTSHDFLTEHGNIEHRLAAVSSRKYETEADGRWLRASFKAVRKEVSEVVQLLDRPQLHELVVAIGRRGSSSRRATSTHLLTAREMATRSPHLFWSLAHAFDGDVERGVRELLSEGAA
jgi:hypothetical protein